jgi:hypothetical protein
MSNDVEFLSIDFVFVYVLHVLLRQGERPGERPKRSVNG